MSRDRVDLMHHQAYNFSVRTTQESRDHLMQLACLRYHTVKVPLQDQNFLRIFFSEVITSSWRSIGTGAPEAASRKKLHMYVKLPAIFRSMVDEILEGQVIFSAGDLKFDLCLTRTVSHGG